MEKGIIFDIIRASTVDGPGIRTSVFFKGCNLRCRWCHNPESQKNEPQLLFFENKCTHCGNCEKYCPYHLTACSLCGKCELMCPTDARKICGREYTVDEVFAEVVKDRMFYENSDGGVTFSGGECMLQIDFLTALLTKCKENGIHTAVDTAGHVPWASFVKILPYTDLFLYDVKCFSSTLHKTLTGVENARILENLKRLTQEFSGDIIVRVPIVKGANDILPDLANTAAYLKGLGIDKVELLPYHKMGEHKYAALGMSCTTYTAPSEAEMITYRALFHN